LHPLVIHYPIAFLTTYVIFELVRIRKILALPYWFYIKATLIGIGEVSALTTLIAAMMSDALVGGNRLVEMYKLFMIAVVIVFGVITLFYLKWPKMLQPFVIIPLAVIGLFFIVIAGGLFGATVYGTHFDPFLAPIFKLLGVY
ncbi:MAG: hypothetical protein HYX23_01670, partial [Candidatus Zambryskibacteria bacterium]|nr:hypothetical protein [Candidatus Zambryskibacteria bacterium]